MKFYFPHIEGLRFVAALLVAIYHIWTDRISGGVDVFFVVSGLLVTLTLLRQVEKNGRINLPHFFSGLALRLFPAALLVLILVLVGTFFLLPPTQHLDTVREILASMLYYENWQLATQATDYLDRENPPSPVQHFWAMSVQGQFYVYAALLFLSSYALRRIRGGIYRALLLLNGSAIALSLTYSIYQTYFGDQIWAYFDTFTRIWEFGFGALLALLLARIPQLSLPVAMGWLGLLAILLCGIIFDVASVFPGVVALFPVTAALVVVLGGRSESRWSVQSLLGSTVMTSLGSISYGIYLFHWPLLIFYQQMAGIRPGLLEGGAIIALSIGLAYFTRQFVERPMLALKSSDLFVGKLRIVALCFVPTFAVTAAAYAGLSTVTERQLRSLNADRLAQPLTLLPASEVTARPATFTPSPEIARRDRPVSYQQRCHTNQRTDVPTWCVYGIEEGFTRTLAMVGGSHTAHWLPALQSIAERRNWRILYSTWSGCRFRIDQQNERCATLSRSALEHLAKLKPDILFTTASASSQSSAADRLETWLALEQIDIPVVAVRGTPRHSSHVPECLATSDDYLSCGSERSTVLSGTFDISMVPENVTVFDLSDYFCSDDFCPATAGGIIIYSDSSHITTTYMQTLAGALEEHVVPAMESSPVQGSVDLATIGVIQADLYCSPLSKETRAISRVINLRVEDASFSFSSGNWREAEGSFEVWDGNIENTAVIVTGRFRDRRAGAVESIDLNGTLHEGTLIAAGSRGNQICSIIARNVPEPPQKDPSVLEGASADTTQDFISANLTCNALGQGGLPFQRSIRLQIEKDRIVHRFGDWSAQEGRFDLWTGTIDDGFVSVVGRYIEGSGGVKQLSLSGHLENGRLELAGRRGPRDCTLSAKAAHLN